MNLCLTGCPCRVGFLAQAGIKQKRNMTPKTVNQVPSHIDHGFDHSPTAHGELDNVDGAMAVERAESWFSRVRRLVLGPKAVSRMQYSSGNHGSTSNASKLHNLSKERAMRRSRLLVLVPATLILPIALFGFFAYQENVATTQTVAVSQGAIMLADKDVVKETTTTTEEPAIEEKRTTTKTKNETKD